MKAVPISLDQRILVECKTEKEKKKLVVIGQYRIATAISTIPIIFDSMYSIDIVIFLCCCFEWEDEVEGERMLFIH